LKSLIDFSELLETLLFLELVTHLLLQLFLGLDALLFELSLLFLHADLEFFSFLLKLDEVILAGTLLGISNLLSVGNSLSLKLGHV